MHPVLIIPLLAFWHAYTACASCMHNTHLDLRSAKADNQQAELDDFGYVGREGPTNWHTIDPQDLICATGRNQSPINIIPTEIRRTKRGDVRTEIPAEQTLSFVNQGTDVEVILRGTTTIGAKKFALRQFHYHTPGEHLINEEYFPVEVHLVHEAEDTGEIAVIGFLFQLTNSIFSSFYDQCNAPEDASIVFTNVLSSIFCIRNPGTTTVLPPISFSPLTNTIRTMAFYTYSGSLTTPPCTENVTWLIATEPLSIPVDAYNALKKVVKFNARFPQNRLGEENLISLACMNLNVTEREGLSLNKDAFETPMQRGKISGMVDSSEKVIALDGASF